MWYLKSINNFKKKTIKPEQVSDLGDFCVNIWIYLFPVEKKIQREEKKKRQAGKLGAGQGLSWEGKMWLERVCIWIGDVSALENSR